MDTTVVSLGVSWFRKIALAHADENGNLILEIDGLPENGPSTLNLLRIFPQHVIDELLAASIFYYSGDFLHRKVCAFGDWFRSHHFIKHEVNLHVRLSQNRNAIILYRNQRARVPEWCDSIALYRPEGIQILEIPLLKKGFRSQVK